MHRIFGSHLAGMIGLAALSWGAVSCSDADNGSGDTPSPGGAPVSFSALQQWDEPAATAIRKAGAASSSTPFAAGDRMGVFAYLNGAAAPDFMNNQCATFDGTSAWTYEPLKYWPADGSDALSFYAYYPWRAAGGDTLDVAYDTEAKVPVLTYDNLDGSFDWMAAAQPSLKYANGKDGVKLRFKHLLARVRFRFTVDDTEDYRPVVHMMEYSVPHYKASFRYEYDADGTPLYAGTGAAEYQGGTVTVRRFVSIPEGVTVTREGTLIDDFTVYLYPCSFPCAGSESSVGTFTFTLNNVKHTFTPPEMISITDKGASYTVNFKIKPNTDDTDFFITSYSIWEDGGEYEGDLE